MEKPKSRRIPDELRRRTRLSCDLCRKVCLHVSFSRYILSQQCSDNMLTVAAPMQMSAAAAGRRLPGLSPESCRLRLDLSSQDAAVWQRRDPARPVSASMCWSI